MSKEKLKYLLRIQLYNDDLIVIPDRSDGGLQTAECQLSRESSEESKQGKFRTYLRVRGRKGSQNSCRVFYLNSRVDGKPLTEMELMGEILLDPSSRCERWKLTYSICPSAVLECMKI